LCPGATLQTMASASPPMPAVRRSPVLLLLALVGLGCQRFPDDTPTAAYRSFLTAVRKERNERVLEMLSTSTRQALTTRAKALSADSGGSLSPDPVALLIGALHPASPTDITVKFDDGEAAVLAVGSAGGSGEVHLRHEAGHWRIRVPALEQLQDG
jgi:hypothetical protein